MLVDRPQFTSEVFRRQLTRSGVRLRYGAIGRTGSIALIERFFRTLKATADLRRKPPLLSLDLSARLQLAFDYYVWLRPHTSLGGATPGECLLSQRPLHADAVPPPRGRPGEDMRTAVPFELRHLGPRRQLPYLQPRAA